MSRTSYRTLRAYLTAKRLKQKELAAMVGVTESAISLYVNRHRIPEPAIALRLSKLCGVPLEVLLTKAA